jgi:hypothetical protein
LRAVAAARGGVYENAAGRRDGFSFGGDAEGVGAAAFAAGSTGGGGTAVAAHRAVAGGAALTAGSGLATTPASAIIRAGAVEEKVTDLAVATENENEQEP